MVVYTSGNITTLPYLFLKEVDLRGESPFDWSVYAFRKVRDRNGHECATSEK